ncbi:MAG: hypothetical protein M3680_01225 [Myxococcota bacterium]|nr:hypothetical protein [Myxococcota bacterium]
MPIDSEATFLVAAPFMVSHGEGELRTSLGPRVANRSTPSAFRDQLGLDPDRVLDTAEVAAFQLASPAYSPVTGYGTPPPVRVRFRPSRPGPFEVVVTVSVEGADGSTDAKTIRVTGKGTQPKRAPEPKRAPAMVDDLHAPDLDKTLEGVIQPASGPAIGGTETMSGAVGLAQVAAELVVDAQADGVQAASDDIRSYQRVRMSPSMLDQIIEIAFMMGVSGIAGVVAKYVAQSIKGQLGTLMTDGLKEGFKNASKVARKELSGAEKPDPERRQQPTISTSAMNEFFGQHRRLVRQRGAQYAAVPIQLSELLRNVEPAQGRAAMMTFARAMSSASAVADQIQAHATKLGWIAAVAHQAHGVTAVDRPDGSKAETTNLDRARSYGSRGWYTETRAPTHDGVLDIHVELPVGATPVEMSGLRVKSASITGVSQEVADWLMDYQLATAGIPIRLVVSGHPALITRDELGRVRINGYLLTKDATSGGSVPQWTEAHMHRGAKLLVDKVLSRTLRAWGIGPPTSDDATGRGNVVP